MADFSQLVQKAFYLGVGLASYATEKAGDGFIDLRQQAQKLVNELVERGLLLQRGIPRQQHPWSRHLPVGRWPSI